MRRNEGVFLGYYENLIEFLSYHPHGIPGGCFVNGETLSLWVWDYVSMVWIDSNRPSNWLSGLVDDPETFVPEHKTGVQTAYMFLAETQGHIVFTHFVNDDVPLSIDVEGVSVVMLFWNGDYWEYRVALVSEDNLSDYAKKDLSNVSADVLREKAGVYEVLCVAYDVNEEHLVSFAEGEDAGSVVGTVAESQTNVLFFTSASGVYGSGIAPVSVKIVYPHSEMEGMSFVATFVGVDDYVHRVVFDEGGTLSQQDAYRIDDLATKSFITSSGYRPMRVIDLGSYRDGAFSLDGTPYWGDMQTTLYSYLDGGCGVLLRAHNQYNEPLVFVPTRIYQDGGTLYVIEFMVSATKLCEIRIDEDADVEGGESLFSQLFTAIGSGGSGTITSEAYTDDKDYKEI